MIKKKTEIVEKNNIKYQRTTSFEINMNGTEQIRGIVDIMLSEPVEPTPDPVMEKLDSIEAKIQTNEDLQTFYDDIVKEVGL